MCPHITQMLGTAVNPQQGSADLLAALRWKRQVREYRGAQKKKKPKHQGDECVHHHNYTDSYIVTKN